MHAKRILIALFVLVAAGPATKPSTQPAKLSADDAKSATTLATEFADKLHRSRYMEGDAGEPIKIAGWENFPTKLYHYTVTDKDGTKKPAAAVMLNPTAGQIATWVVSGLIETRGKYDAEAGRKMFKHILSQSGGQFPVRGVVYEDMEGDGKSKIYCFRDGVTCAIEGVPHRGIEVMTAEQTKASLEGKVTRVYQYARIQSTNPTMWIASGNSKDVIGADGKPKQKWLDEVREAYQAAWNSERNELLVAWLKANPN